MRVTCIEVRTQGPRVEGSSPLPATLVADLRTDHAGETGAVMIYRGILATTRYGAVRHFAREHLATEAGHLAAIEPLLSRRQRSRLLPLWRIAGWLTGALPALFGPRAVYATIEAVVWAWLVGTGSRGAVSPPDLSDAARQVPYSAGKHHPRVGEDGSKA